MSAEDVHMTGLRLGMLAMALGAATAAAQAPDGAALYRQNCRACHGTAGTPSAQIRVVYKRIPSLADPAFQAARSDDSLVAVVTNGVGKDMKPFKGKLSHEETVAVVKYVRGLAASKSR